MPRDRSALAGRPLVTAGTALLLTTGCGGDPGNQAAATATVPPTVADCSAFAGDGSTATGAGTLPTLRLPCLTGGPEVTLADLGGRPVLVNLWASWCAPCREEMPLLQKAYEQNGERIGFLGVDTEDSRTAAASFLEDFRVTYAHVVDRDRRLLDALALPGLPVTLAVGPDGRILDRQVGQMSPDRLQQLVGELRDSAGSAPS